MYLQNTKNFTVQVVKIIGQNKQYCLQKTSKVCYTINNYTFGWVALFFLISFLQTLRLCKEMFF